jgi:hypothetical protein
MSSNRISFQCSVFMIGLAAIFMFARIGFGVDVWEIAKVIGIGFFVIFFSELFYFLASKRARLQKGLIYDDSLQTITGIAIIVFFGFFFGTKVCQYVFMVIGYTLFVLNFAATLKKIDKSQMLEILGVLVFTLGAGTLCWGGRYFSPIFIEKLAAGEFSNEDFGNGLDTLFHMSIMQMIKTYNISSIGVDGLIPIKYHVGSHFVLAQFSKVLNVSVNSMYQLGYPVIFLPTFLKVFLSSIFRIRKSLAINGTHSRFSFWTILLLFTFGFIPFESVNLSAEGLLTSNSYLFSLLIFFSTLSIAFTCFKSESSIQNSNKPYAFLLIAILVLISGIFKVSTMVVGIAGLGFFFLRLKLYFNVVYLSIFVFLIASFFFIQQLVSPSFGTMEFGFLYSYTKFIKTSFFVFVPIYYFLFSITVFFYQRWVKVAHSLSLRSMIRYKYLLEIEALIVLAVVGFIPGTAIKIEGGSAFYFAEIQYWVSLAMLLAILPEIPQILPKQVPVTSYSRMFISVILLITVLNILIRITLFIYSNYQTRSYLLYATSIPTVNPGKQVILRKIWKSNPSKIIEALGIFSKPVIDSLHRKYLYKISAALMLIDQRKDRGKSIIFIGNYLRLIQNFSCHKYPFIIPALSGVCTYQGYDKETCNWMRNYGVEDIGVPNRSFYAEPSINICTRILDKRFMQIIVFNLDQMKYDIERCE